MVSLEMGKELIALARESILSYFEREEPAIPKKSYEKRGAFVTLKTYPGGELRGCIGYPYPIKELYAAVSECAVSSAFHDPRFPPLEKKGLDSVIVEVSVLTPPKPVTVKHPEEYLQKIIVGKHGLIAEFRGFSGLLLPQVPVEWNWDVKTFLEQTCIKAGLPPQMWLNPEISFYSFEAEIFSEKKPNGEVVKVEGGENESKKD